MAEENKNLQNNADGIPEDIDELLANAGKSLSELSDEVGQEDKESSSNIELERDEKVSDVDSILSSLAAELENIGEDITDEVSEEPDEKLHEDVQSEPQPDIQSETQLDFDAVGPGDEGDLSSNSEDSFQDPLAELAAELEQMNGSALKEIEEPEVEMPGEQDSAKAEAGDESIDDIVEGAIKDVSQESVVQADSQNDTEPEIESTQEVQESVDDVLARLANEINEEHLEEPGTEPSNDAYEPEDEVNSIVEDELAEMQQQAADNVSELPVESDEAVEAIEEVNSLGVEETSADADAELDDMASEVEKVLNGFADAVVDEQEGVVKEQPQEPTSDAIAKPDPQAKQPEPIIDEDIARQLADLSDILDENAQEEPEDSVAEAEPPSKASIDDDISDPPISDSEKVMPHAEDVLRDLDKQMNDLNDLVNEETDSADAADDIVLQELEDKVAPRKKDKSSKQQSATLENPTEQEKPARIGMSATQKAVISGLQATNKPFEKVVKGQAKDTLGLVAILTFAISIATLGFYLLFGGNQY